MSTNVIEVDVCDEKIVACRKRHSETKVLSEFEGSSKPPKITTKAACGTSGIS